MSLLSKYFTLKFADQFTFAFCQTLVDPDPSCFFVHGVQTSKLSLDGMI